MSTSWNSTWRWTQRNSAVALGACVVAAAIARGVDAAPAPVPNATAAPAPTAAADPCLQLGNLVSRPSFSTSACVVKRRALLVQSGYSNLTTSEPGGSRLVTVPQIVLSTGVVQNVEVDYVAPSAARMDGATFAAGTTDGGLGFKAQIGQTSKFTYGVNALYTLQTGSAPFSAGGDGLLANVNASFVLSPAAGLFATLGYNAQSSTLAQQPARYHDVQPSLGISLALPQSFTVYAEGFDQSSTGPGTSGTFGFDTGLQKDIGSRLQLDAEIYGYPGVHARQHQHAVGFGAAYLFGP